LPPHLGLQIKHLGFVGTGELALVGSGEGGVLYHVPAGDPAVVNLITVELGHGFVTGFVQGSGIHGDDLAFAEFAIHLAAIAKIKHHGFGEYTSFLGGYGYGKATAGTGVVGFRREQSEKVLKTNQPRGSLIPS